MSATLGLGIVPKKPAAPKTQVAKFRALARELGADEDEKAFEEKVRNVAASSNAPKGGTAKRGT